MILNIRIMNLIVGNNLKTICKAKNMTQEQIADHLNISQSAYARKMVKVIHGQIIF